MSPTTTLETTPAPTAVAPDPAAGPKFNARRAWLVTVLLVGFMLINFGDKAVLGLAAGPMMHELNITAEQYGLISSAFYALFSIATVAVGFVANRVPSKWIIAAMAVLWSLTQLPIVAFASVGVIVASRVALGAFEGPSNPLAINAVQKWFPNEKRNLPTALINVGAALGVVILAPALTVVIVNFGWRAGFIFMCVVGIVWSIAWAILGREGKVDDVAPPRPAVSDQPVTALASKVPYRRIFLSGTGISVLLAGFGLNWGLAILVAWIPVYLGTPLGLGTAAAGTLVVLPWLASAILMALQGLVTDRLMARGVPSRIARGLLGAVSVVFAATSLILTAVVPSIPMKIVLLTLAFSVGGMQYAIGMTMMAEISPVRQRAAVLSLVVALTGLAGLISPMLTGMFVQAHGVTSPTGFHYAFGVTGVLMLIGGFSSLFFARPERDARRIAAQG